LAKADHAARTFAAQPGAKVLFGGGPRFHEFVLETQEETSSLGQRLLDGEIVGGVALSRWYPELPNATLWCATEVITKEQIDAAAGILAGAPVEV